MADFSFPFTSGRKGYYHLHSEETTDSETRFNGSVVADEELQQVEGDSGRPARMNLLLIGSAGNGKSSLGNFLLNCPCTKVAEAAGVIAADDGDENSRNESGEEFSFKEIFQTACTNYPQTASVQVEHNLEGRTPLAVMDTPGLNEGAEKDLSHMIEIVREVKNLGSITACILCVKFDSKIDAQYRATIAYYRKLLPTLFERNVVIVLTNFLMDEYSEKRRRRQKISVDAIVKDTQREVKEIGDLRFEPQVFLIDSLPSTNMELSISEKNRESMLDYIQKSLDPVKIEDMTVAKTIALQLRDEKEISSLDGEIHGYNTRLQEANEAAKGVLEKIEHKQKKVSSLKGDIQRLKAESKEKDSEAMMTTKMWSVEDSWKWFQWQSKSFEVASAWPVVKYTRWDNGHLEWKDFQLDKEKGEARGRVEGKWFRGLYANLTLLSQKRVVFKGEIEKLEAEVTSLENKLTEKTRSVAEHEAKHIKYKTEIDLLIQYIQARSVRKEQLMVDPITIDEAHKRLKELRS